jgi:hypothetical protein
LRDTGDLCASRVSNVSASEIRQCFGFPNEPSLEGLTSVAYGPEADRDATTAARTRGLRILVSPSSNDRRSRLRPIWASASEAFGPQYELRTSAERSQLFLPDDAKPHLDQRHPVTRPTESTRHEYHAGLIRQRAGDKGLR